MNIIKISDGELLDKYAILSIKLDEIKDRKKLENIKKEHAYIQKKARAFLIDSKYLNLFKLLLNVNRKLWRIEDKIRDKERLKKFDKEFIKIARSIYKLNDQRFNIKNNINTLNILSFKEEKSYKPY
jgi:hypothetical protein